MDITIGGRTLAITRPGDLDAVLIGSTGCAAAEHVRMLRGGATSFQIARVLHLMLSGEDAPSVAGLVDLIDAGDALEVRRATIAALTVDRPEHRDEA